MDRYRRAAKERRQPRHLAELRRYLRMEYEQGTGPGFLLKERAKRARRPRRRIRRAIRRVVRAMARVKGALAAGNGRRPASGGKKTTR